MANSKESLVKALEELLGNVFSMYVRTHGAHWNVRGSDFAEYHDLFETVYSDVYESIDPIAENIRKLDSDAPASLGEFAKLDGLAEAPVSGQSEQVLTQDIIDANRVVLESLFDAFKIANDINEQGIANFLAERIDMHQKWNWQLSASLEKSSSLIRCAACGEGDACQGHSLDADPVGYEILANHRVDDHLSCHPLGCKVAGRSVHAHPCVNCGEQAGCTAKVSNSACEERNTICANCLPKLARIDHFGKDGIKERMRLHVNGNEFDNVSDETIELALGEAHSIEQARKINGPHRPAKGSIAEAAREVMPDAIAYESDGGNIFHTGCLDAVMELPKGDYLFSDDDFEPGECDVCGEKVKPSLEPRKGSSDSSSDSFVPPSSVASAAKRGLALRKKYNRGGTEIGVARARDLSNRKGLSYKTVKRMKAYFDRHEVDKKGEGWGKDSAGYIAWLLWGGDAGRSWANKIIKQKEKNKKQSSVGSFEEKSLPQWIEDALDIEDNRS